MSEMSPIIAELERVLVIIDKQFPVPMNAPVLPTPVITVASRGRAEGVLGWYIEPVWQDTNEDTLQALSGKRKSQRNIVKRPEFVIASEALSEPERAVSELARLLLQQRGQVPRVKPGVWYFSRMFLKRGATVGHVAGVEKGAENKGWRRWEPTDGFKQHVFKQVDWSVFDLTRGGTKTHTKVGSRMHKWNCGCTLIRSATFVDALCNLCGKSFVWAEGFAELKHTNFVNTSSKSYLAGSWAKVVKNLVPYGWTIDEAGRAVGCESCHGKVKGNGLLCDGEGPGTYNTKCPAYVATTAAP